MKLVWYTVLIRAIPEALGMVILTLAVIKEKRNMRQIAIVSLLCGLTAFIMRMMPIKFGIHTLISIIIQVFVMNIIFNIKIQKIFKGVLVALIVLITSEIVTFLFIQYILKLNAQAIFEDSLNTLLAGIPSIILPYIIAFFIHRSRKNMHIDKGFNGNVN